MPAKLLESSAGKIGVIAVAVLAVGAAIFIGVKSTSGDSQPADPGAVKAAAQTQIDVLNKNPNLPPALKAEMIAHARSQMGGPAVGANAGPNPAAH